jgi:hypothetical protein
MATTLLRVWGHVQRSCGYEVRADYNVEGVIYNEMMVFPTNPGTAAITAAAEVRRKELRARANPTKAQVLAQLQAELASAVSEETAATEKKLTLQGRISAAAVAVLDPQ